MHDDSSTAVTTRLLLAALFIALNGFFVAAEFALVKLRPGRLEPKARKGSSSAKLTLHIVEHMDLYLSGCQLGITLASLVLGWIAEPAVASVLRSGLTAAGIEVVDGSWVSIGAVLVAFAIITLLHMTVGEQAPKIFAIHRPEPVALVSAWPLQIFVKTFQPFIWVVNAISNLLLRLVGLDPAGEHGEAPGVQELGGFLLASSKAGHISPRQLELARNVLDLMALEVRHILVPRVDVVKLSTTVSSAENWKRILESGHSRLPLGAPDFDSVVGLVHTKDLVEHTSDSVDFTTIVRNIPFVSETQPLSAFIRELQKQRVQSAIVLDEHGTAVGMAFLEDALEEIVGPIYDEFDQPRPDFVEIEDGVFEMVGELPLPEAENLLNVSNLGSADTIGGAITTGLERLPKKDDKIVLSGVEFSVLALRRRRIDRVRARRLPEE